MWRHLGDGQEKTCKSLKDNKLQVEEAGIEPASGNRLQKRLHACSADLFSRSHLPSGQASENACLSVFSLRRPEVRRVANLLYVVVTRPRRYDLGHASGD